MGNNWDELKTKYTKAKSISSKAVNRGKKIGQEIKSNDFYRIWIFTAIIGILILLVYGGNLIFTWKELNNPNFWIRILVTGFALTLLFTSLVGFYAEEHKKKDLYTKMVKQYQGQVFCANNNQDKGTHKGIKSEVETFNRNLCERVWRDHLIKVCGSFYGTSINVLNENFSEFFNLEDKDFEEFFKEKEFSKKQQYNVMKVVYRIRAFDYKIKGMIITDDLLYDTSTRGQVISPVFSEKQEAIKGIIYKFMSYIAMSVLFASIFIDGLNIWKVLTSIFSVTFSIVLTFIMADTNAKHIHTRRTNSLKKKVCMLESGFNRCQLSVEIRAKFYIPVTREDGFEEIYEYVPPVDDEDYDRPSLEEAFPEPVGALQLNNKREIIIE